MSLNDKMCVLHKPGYIYTSSNDNLFIIYGDDYILMKKDFVYNIDVDFTLEFIHLDCQIVYMYHMK